MTVVADIHLIGTAAARPAASSSNNGYLYTATDTAGGTTYRSNGSSWVQVAAGVSASGGGDVSGPGSSTNNDIAIWSGTGGTTLADSGKTLPAGAVVGTSDSQSLTNKTLDNTNSIAGDAITSSTVAAARLGLMTGDSGLGGAKGAVPAPASGDAAAAKFLKADGTWAVPAGSGGSPGGSDKNIQYNNSSAFGGIANNATATKKYLQQVSSGTPSFVQVADADLSVTDVTTNNVTSTAHGFAPKSPADATQFLNGAATPAFAAVKDSDLSTSDITTNNVSITKHGFAPKAPNDATKYLDGTGAYSTPAGGAATMDIIQVQVFS